MKVIQIQQNNNKTFKGVFERNGCTEFMEKQLGDRKYQAVMKRIDQGVKDIMLHKDLTKGKPGVDPIFSLLSVGTVAPAEVNAAHPEINVSKFSYSTNVLHPKDSADNIAQSIINGCVSAYKKLKDSYRYYICESK